MMLGITEPDLSIPQFVQLATGYRADIKLAGSVATERSDTFLDAYRLFKDNS